MSEVKRYQLNALENNLRGEIRSLTQTFKRAIHEKPSFQEEMNRVFDCEKVLTHIRDLAKGFDCYEDLSHPDAIDQMIEFVLWCAKSEYDQIDEVRAMQE